MSVHCYWGDVSETVVVLQWSLGVSGSAVFISRRHVKPRKHNPERLEFARTICADVDPLICPKSPHCYFEVPSYWAAVSQPVVILQWSRSFRSCHTSETRSWYAPFRLRIFIHTCLSLDSHLQSRFHTGSAVCILEQIQHLFYAESEVRSLRFKPEHTLRQLSFAEIMRSRTVRFCHDIRSRLLYKEQNCFNRTISGKDTRRTRWEPCCSALL